MSGSNFQDVKLPFAECIKNENIENNENKENNTNIDNLTEIFELGEIAASKSNLIKDELKSLDELIHERKNSKKFTKDCRFGPSCQKLKKGNCNYIHPPEDVRCRFELQNGICGRNDCEFKHKYDCRGNILIYKKRSFHETDIKEAVFKNTKLKLNPMGDNFESSLQKDIKLCSDRELKLLLTSKIDIINFDGKTLYKVHDKAYSSIFDILDNI